MWHASISFGGRVVLTEQMFDVARRELYGVGDRDLGEWREVGEIAVHLRRRCTGAEAAILGPVIDVRGTLDGAARLHRMSRYLPPAWREEV